MGRDMPTTMSRAVGDELKTSWPEVVGMALFPTMMKIAQDRPDVQIEVHWVGETVPPGFNDKRVRVFLNRDANHTVAKTPLIG